jgi:D-alanyl-D-alanine carboxypeptidase/D-alanyl-D-alanine-endopeptidase (penicillin-binding protein 4)
MATRWFWLVILALGPARCVSAADDLAKGIDAIIAAPEFKHAHWGILVVDLDSGTSLYDLNGDKLFIPASTTKLYTVAAALEALGADFRFQTPVYRRGSLKDGVVDGDLILVASGDPTMGGRTDAHGRIAFTNSDHIYADGVTRTELTEPDPLGGLIELARQIAAAGVKEVRGEIVIDDRLFPRAESSGSGPGAVSPIMINDNVVDFVIAPCKAGESAKVSWRPQASAVLVDADVRTVGAGGETKISIASPGRRRYVVRGTIAEGHHPVIHIDELTDPASFARSALIDALRRAGIATTASAMASNPTDRLPGAGEYDKLERIAELTSPPFAEHARLILKVSHNLHASLLPVLLAKRRGGATVFDGLKVEREILDGFGVDTATISFGGGAGGARADHVTPRATIQLLRHMATRSDFAAFHDALPILGVDGTLAKAVGEQSPARGKIHAKTGTLTWTNGLNDKVLMTSKALAGYATAASGRRLAFAFFVNHVHLDRSQDATRVGQTLGKLCDMVHRAL